MFLKSKGAAFGNDQDEIVIVPLKMYQKKIKGSKDISSILLSIEGKYIEKCKSRNYSINARKKSSKTDESLIIFI